MSGINLQGATLTDAKFAGADLGPVDIKDRSGQPTGREWPANLAGARVLNTDFTGANLEAANLKGADFTGARLARARAQRADLEGAVLDQAQRKQLGLKAEG